MLIMYPIILKQLPGGGMKTQLQQQLHGNTAQDWSKVLLKAVHPLISVEYMMLFLP